MESYRVDPGVVAPCVHPMLGLPTPRQEHVLAVVRAALEGGARLDDGPDALRLVALAEVVVDSALRPEHEPVIPAASLGSTMADRDWDEADKAERNAARGGA